jgi:uncharacterized damage-inducible protein DinB
MTTSADERREALLAELRATQADLLVVLDRVGPDDWGRIGAANQEWTVLGLLTHLSTAERGFVGSVKRQASGGGGVPADFDRDRWNASQLRRNAEASPAQLRAQLDAAHAELIALVADLDDAALDERGWLTVGREGSVEELLRVVASHKREHTADIAKVVGDR